MHTRGSGTMGARSLSQAGAAGDRPSQPGDWSCKVCGFTPNFARRRDCFKCRRARSPRTSGAAAAAGNTSGFSNGPVGAGGRRPMLGGRGNAGAGGGVASKPADTSPTHRVPGSSVAARAAAVAPGGGSWAEAARRGGAGGAAAPAVGGGGPGRAAADPANRDGLLDDEGFRMVTRRGGGGAARAAERTESRGQGQEPPSGNQAGGDEVGTGTHEDGDATGRPTVADLQQAWHNEVAVVRRLRQQGLQGGHPAMQAACEARDAAERAWRESKEPAPASVRLGRAQAKLDKAIALQADARQSLLDTERAHRERMAELQSAMDECTERVRLRKQQLREVQDEVAEGGRGGHAHRTTRPLNACTTRFAAKSGRPSPPWSSSSTRPRPRGRRSTGCWGRCPTPGTCWGAHVAVQRRRRSMISATTATGGKAARSGPKVTSWGGGRGHRG